MSALALAPSPAQQPMPMSASGAQLVGYGAVWNQWARISTPKGAFMEKIARGAFTRTLQERAQHVRVLLEHGTDARVGNRPLGPLVSLSEDEYGLHYVCDLFRADYVDEIRPALASGLYSSSFQFRTLVEDFDPRPPASDFNPSRLPQVVLRTLDLYEIGPVCFPAYAGARAGLRSAGVTARPTLSLVDSPTAKTRTRSLFWYVDPPKKAGPAWRL